MKKLNGQQIIAFLKKSNENYLKQYYQGGSIYDDEGNDIGTFSEKVFQRLLDNGIIKLVGRSEESWSEGYYRLNGK